MRATTEQTRRNAERRLLSDLGSAIDSRLDTVVHRRLSRVLTRGLVALGVTPNTISVLSVIIGLVGAWCWARASVGGALLGLALYLLSVVLDHSDGEVARLTFAESRLGAWLDTLGDTLVHASGAVALGLAAQRLEGTGLLYGGLAAIGFIASALVSKTLPRPKVAHGLARTVGRAGDPRRLLRAPAPLRADDRTGASSSPAPRPLRRTWFSPLLAQRPRDAPPCRGDGGANGASGGERPRRVAPGRGALSRSLA